MTAEEQQSGLSSGMVSLNDQSQVDGVVVGAAGNINFYATMEAPTLLSTPVLEQFQTLIYGYEWESPTLWSLYDASNTALGKASTEFPRFATSREVLRAIITHLNGLPRTAAIPAILMFFHKLIQTTPDVTLHQKLITWFEHTLKSLGLYERWQAEVAGLPAVAIHQDQPSASPSYLLIKLERDVHTDTWFVQAYVWKHIGPYMPVELDSGDDQQRYQLQDIPRILSMLLEEKIDAIASTDSATPESIVIEWLIPSELLDADIDHWNSDITDDLGWPIGHRHPVVVRLIERVVRRKKWALAWNTHQPWFRGTSERAFGHVAWVCLTDQCAPATLNAQLMQEGSCLALVGALNQLTSEQRKGLLASMLQSGASLALLPRRPFDEFIGRVTLEELVRVGGALLGILRERRQQAAGNPGELLHAITILWDDPNRPFGDDAVRKGSAHDT